MKEPILTLHTAPQFCPVCFKMLDAVTVLTGGVAPEPGDFTICIECRSILRYGEGMQLEKSSLMEIPEHSRLEFVKVLRIMEEALPPPRSHDGKTRPY